MSFIVQNLSLSLCECMEAIANKKTERKKKKMRKETAEQKKNLM